MSTIYIRNPFSFTATALAVECYGQTDCSEREFRGKLVEHLRTLAQQAEDGEALIVEIRSRLRLVEGYDFPMYEWASEVITGEPPVEAESAQFPPS